MCTGLLVAIQKPLGPTITKQDGVICFSPNRHRCQSPIHLAHPLKDEHAVVIHALGPSLQGSRQNRGEPCCLLPTDTPSRGSVVVTTRRLCTIHTRAPFNHVEIDLQNAPLAEDEFGHRYQCELRTLAEDRAARSEK